MATSVSIADEKKQLRQQILAQRHALGAAARAAAAAVICDKIRQLPQYQQANSIAAFAPMDEEVDIWQLLDESKAKNKIVVLPRVAGKRQLSFHLYTNRADLCKGYKNILEPRIEKKIFSLQYFDFIIIPAVSIDKQKKRLGYGGGFYDTVIYHNQDIYTCAPLFNCQVVDTLPCESHDQSIDIVITE